MKIVGEWSAILKVIRVVPLASCLMADFSLTYTAVRALRNHPTRIWNGDEARRLHGVGEKTAQKVIVF